MMSRVVQIGQRRDPEWKSNTNYSQNLSRKPLLPIAKLKVNKLHSSVRTDLCEQGIYSLNNILTNSLEQAEELRANLLREKLQLENKLQNLNESGIFSHDTNPDRHPGTLEKKIVDLKSELAEKQDAAAAATEKMRRAEMVAAEAQKEIATERQSIVQLHKDKVFPHHRLYQL